MAKDKRDRSPLEELERQMKEEAKKAKSDAKIEGLVQRLNKQEDKANEALKAKQEKLQELEQARLQIAALKAELALQDEAKLQKQITRLPVDMGAQIRQAEGREALATMLSGGKVPDVPVWKVSRFQPQGTKVTVHTAEQLYSLACEYFEYMDASALTTSAELTTAQGVDPTGAGATDYKQGKIRRKMRPYTLSGLCSFIGFTASYMSNLKTSNTEIYEDESRDFLERENARELVACVDWIKEVIYTNKYNGAATGMFNSDVIMREIGRRLETEGEADKVEAKERPKITVRDAQTAGTLDDVISRLENNDKEGES